MYTRHIILEMQQVVKNKSFALANRMATRYPLSCWDSLQLALNMVHHFVGSGVSPRPVLIGAPVISDVYNTLGPLQIRGKGSSSRDCPLRKGCSSEDSEHTLLSVCDTGHLVDRRVLLSNQ